MNLPKAFEDKMRELLKEDEYEAYLQSYSKPKYQGIRINTMKVPLPMWGNINPFKDTEKVEWCEEGFYYTESRPTKHPYYFAGLYYVQEPSAMAPGAYLPVEEGDFVLDLCAAPGGKTTQIAAHLRGTGVLVSNDISTGRTTALHKNVVMFGAKNAVVTNESPERLADKWGQCFDKIIIDAPCSGEGMFRKDEGAIKSWETHGVDYCMPLQESILKSADELLKPGGMILYSTCTFSPEENEGMIDLFLKEHPEYQVVPLQGVGGITQGKPEWIGACGTLQGALRLWPHLLKGEGHFVCLIQKQGEKPKNKKVKQEEQVKIKSIDALKQFIETYTFMDVNQKVTMINDKIYLIPEGMPSTKGLRVIRSGLQLGTMKGKRFEPDHGLVLAYPKEMFKSTIDLTMEDAVRYLKGETLLIDAPKGYHVVCIDNFPLGWVKGHNGTLKNQYPPSWRMMG